MNLRRVKDKKVGEGTYAVVYQGQFHLLLQAPFFQLVSLVGREASTGRKVAIKKIKVGQFKDGLDMSAIREVKYLRELKHQNVIEVCPLHEIHISRPFVDCWKSYSMSFHRKQI